MSTLTSLFSDSFTRADSETVGNGWTETTDLRAAIVGNKLRMNGPGNYYSNLVYQSGITALDAKCQFDFNASGLGSGYQIQLWGRVSQANPAEGFFLNLTASELRLQRRRSGALTTLQSVSVVLATGVNYRLEFWVGGTNENTFLRGRLTNLDTPAVIAEVEMVYNEANFNSAGWFAISVAGTSCIFDCDDFQLYTWEADDILLEEIKNLAGTVYALNGPWTVDVYSVGTGQLIKRHLNKYTDGNGQISLLDNFPLRPSEQYRFVVDNGTIYGISTVTTPAETVV